MQRSFYTPMKTAIGACYAALRGGVAIMLGTIEQRVKKSFAEYFGLDPEKIELPASLRTDLGADEHDLTALVLGLEEEFEIPDTIPNEQWNKVVTVGDAVDLVRAMLPADYEDHYK